MEKITNQFFDPMMLLLSNIPRIKVDKICHTQLFFVALIRVPCIIKDMKMFPIFKSAKIRLIL